jgi:uncharacterized RDD family membrane protein YckC
VLSSGEHSCRFCDHSEVCSSEESSVSTLGSLTLRGPEEEWRGELNQRLQAYRARRRKTAPNRAQTQLPFENTQPAATVALEPVVPGKPALDPEEDFAFTIAIGRPPRKQEPDDTRLLIDVSLPPQAEENQTPETPGREEPASQLYPVASLDERRRAASIDAACLLFAYGGFLALFGSLGGQFTLSKLSAVVCVSTFAFVYVQYFCLFTIFGGTTPGMMIRGLQVASFSGEAPTARQLFWRATGYLISAGTFFLGFFWAMWDEDALTWHDRISRTYLAVPESFADAEIAHTAPVR